MPRGGGDSFGGGSKATRKAKSRASSSSTLNSVGSRARYKGSMKALTIGKKKKKKK